MILRLQPFLIVALLAPGAVSTPALAQDAGWFIGAAGGQSRARDSCPVPPFTCDDRGAAWKVFGGYQFNPNIGFEVGYADLGKVIDREFAGITTVTFEATAIDAVLFLSMPIGQQLSVFIKGGIFAWELDRTITGAGAGKTNVDGRDSTWGLGAKYKLSSNAALRLDWQRYSDVGDPDITGRAHLEVILVGLDFRF